MSFIFLRNRVTGGAAFSPASLFASGEEGAWFDFSTTAAFKSTTDLTPCEFGTGVITDQQCGFLLDKSKGAGYSGGSFTGLGSELVAGGEFNDAGDLAEWTAESASIALSHDAANQRMQVVTTSHLSNGFYQDITTVAGAGYFVSIDATRSDINTRAYNGAFLNAINVGGTDTLYFIAESTTTRIYFRCPVASATYFVDNISVRELPGNHATQATATARPILARVPEGGRRNELSETDTLATQSVTVTAAERTLSFTGTGTVTLTGASTAGPLVGTGAGDRVSLTFTPSAGSLTLTVSGTVTDAQLELGASATTYQSVADSLGYDITEAGVTSLEYLAFDGADDFLLNTSLTHNATMHLSISAYVETSNDSRDAIFFFGTGGGLYQYGLYQFKDATNARGFNTWNNDMTGSTPATLDTPFVDSAVFNNGVPLAAGNTYFRNGVGQSLSVITGTPVSMTMASGFRIAQADSTISNQNLIGRIYGIVLLDRAKTTSERQNTEAYLANLSGVTL